jgi:adenylate cyclase
MGRNFRIIVTSVFMELYPTGGYIVKQSFGIRSNHVTLTHIRSFIQAPKGDAMSIRKKTFCAIVAALAIMIVILYFLLSSIILRQFQKIEQDDAAANTERARDAFQNRIASIDGGLFTNAQWDDCYNYMLHPTKAFEDNNLGESMFTGINLNYILFIDKNKKILYAQSYDFATKQVADVPANILELFKPESPLFVNTDPSISTRGFVIVEQGTVLIDVAPATNTAKSELYSGYIAFARIFDKEEQQKLSEVTHMSLTFSTEGEIAAGATATPVDKHIIDGRVSLNDLYGKPAYHLTVHLPRVIYNEGLQSFRMLIASVIVVGVLFCFLVLLLLNGIVLRRISGISNRVHEISEKMDFNLRVEETGSDEISRLGHQINGLTAAVSEIIHALEEEK